MMRIFLGISIGAVIGFAIGYFGKCTSGTCPLTSNPWTSMVVGGIVGLIIAMSK